MDKVSLQAFETLGLVMAILFMMAVSSFAILRALRAIADENSDEETRQRAYENVLFSYGWFLPYYAPDIRAINSENKIDVKVEAKPEDVIQTEYRSRWQCEIEEDHRLLRLEKSFPHD